MLVLSEEVAELELGVVDGLVVQEVELFEDVNEVDLVVSSHILAHYALELPIELKDAFCLQVFWRNDFWLMNFGRLFLWWKIWDWSGLEESIPAHSLVADEAQVAQITNRRSSS